MKLVKLSLSALGLFACTAYADDCVKAIENMDKKTVVSACQKILDANPQDATTQYRTGVAYDLTGDYKKAIEYYIKSAEQGNDKAQYNLGTLYYNGEGTTRDYAKALEYYTKSAEQGNPEAQFNLAVMYRYGEGVSKDKATAKVWFGKACDSGIKEACSRR
ncbi:MAG: tetratricopeptide repeat protein [Moraxella sp.]|nr:tetratricopeptide repeat protein [Moraxella sp.]